MAKAWTKQELITAIYIYKSCVLYVGEYRKDVYEDIAEALNRTFGSVYCQIRKFIKGEFPVEFVKEAKAQFVLMEKRCRICSYPSECLSDFGNFDPVKCSDKFHKRIDPLITRPVTGEILSGLSQLPHH